MRLAERAGLAIIVLPADASTAPRRCWQPIGALRPESESALARLLAAHAAIERVGDSNVEAVLDAAGRASGRLTASERGRRRGARRTRKAPARAIRRRPSCSGSAADAVARVQRSERRRDELRARSRAQLLAELLTGTAERSTVVAERARSRGLPVDGWHRVARLELAGQADDDQLAAEERMDDVSRIAARVIGGQRRAGC